MIKLSSPDPVLLGAQVSNRFATALRGATGRTLFAFRNLNFKIKKAPFFRRGFLNIKLIFLLLLTICNIWVSVVAAWIEG